MSASKLSSILSAIYDAIEATAPFYEQDKGFTRYRDELDLSLTDPGLTFRNFRVSVLSVGRGPKPDQRDKHSRQAVLQVQVNYPLSYQMASADDPAGLGIEALRQDDGRLIEDTLCHRRPAPVEAIMSGTSPLLWQGSFLVGRLWTIQLSIDYMETTTP